MRLTSFKDLIVYQAAIRAACATYRLTAGFPSSELYGMAAQMRRAAVSIPANIAEGYARSRRGYMNHVNIALGSANELETLCIVARQVGVAAESDIVALEQGAIELQKMIAGLQRALGRGASRDEGA